MIKNPGVISTGSLKLDIALQIGGYPSGSIIEISGPTGSGKTVLAQHAVAEAQLAGGICAWIDADQMFSVQMAKNIGVNPDTLYYCNSNNTEQALGILHILAKSGSFSLVVLDSIQTLIPNSETLFRENRQPAEENYRLISLVLAMIKRDISDSNTTVFFTNSTGKRSGAAYHLLSKQLDRLALTFYSGIRISLLHDHFIQHSGLNPEVRIKAQILKNQFAPCLYKTDFDIINPVGINKTGEVFSLGCDLQLILRQEEGFIYQDICLGKTFSQIIHTLNENRAIRDEIEQKIRQRLLPDIYPAAD